MDRGRVAIIGAGLGGLSAAARLAHAGFWVDVYEQAEGPGGKAGSLEMAGYRFDTGPSLVTMPLVMEQAFSDCGAEPSQHLRLERLDPICNYFWSN